MVKKKPKLSLEQFIDNNGISCPFCGEQGGIEADHSFEFCDQKARLNVVCTICEKYHTQIYSFEKWKTRKNKSVQIDVCPKCGANVVDEDIENLRIDVSERVYGELVCPECEAESTAIFKLTGWE